MGFSEKGQVMWKVVMILTTSLFLTGCQGWPEWNREKLNELEVGMTKPEVLEIMGKPYQREANQQQEWWLYMTESGPGIASAYREPSEYLTPIVFDKEGKVIGWGRNYWTEKEKKYEVKINQKIRKE